MKYLLFPLSFLILTACSGTKSVSKTSDSTTATATFTDESLKKALKKEDQVIVLEFWAEWCAPCKMLDPILQELAAEYEGKAIVGKMDVDDNTYSKLFYEIGSIPMILIFKNGKIVDQQKGLTTKVALSEKIDMYL
ncbi:MAG: thioredoxin [Bacteroidota bacterium]